MTPGVPEELMADPAVDPITDQQVADPMMDDPIVFPSIMPEDGRGISLSFPAPKQQAPTSAPQQPQLPGQQTGSISDIEGYQEPQQRGRRSSSPMGLGFNKDYRYTQEDFYGKDKDITWTDPRGVQMYVPSAGKLPMSIAASVLQNTQSALQKVQEAKMKLLEQPKIQTADPYQQSFNQLFADMRSDFIQSKAEMYGSEDQVWREIVNNPQMANEWSQIQRDAEAVAQSGKWAWDEAKGYLDRAATGEHLVVPEVKKRAEEVYNGLGNLKGTDGLPSIRKLLGNIEAFSRDISRDQFIKEYILPHVEKMYQKGSTQVQYKKNGRIAQFEWNDTESLPDDFYDYLAAQYMALSPGDTKEQAMAYFKKIIPQLHQEKNLQLRTIPEAGGGSGSGEAVKKGSDYPLSESKLPTFIREDKPKQGEPGYGVIKNENDKYQTISLTEPVSKKEQIPQTRSFVKNGDDTPMIPLRLMDVDGTLYIVGKESRYTGETSVGGSSGGGRVSLDDEDETPAAVSSIADFKRLPDIRVPYSGNETVFKEYFPGLDEESVMEIFGSRSKSKKGTAPTPEEFNSKWAKLPKGSSMIGPDGETYIKE